MNLNIYGVVILAALLINFLIELAAELLNLRALRAELPAEFAELYEAREYQKAQDYTRSKTKFGLLTGAFDLAALLGFWYLGGFYALDLTVRALGYGPVWTGLIFTGLLLLLKTILSLPFSLYSTFVIEERFGFNRTTPLVYITDLLKGVLLAGLLGGPLLAGILALFERFGSGAWLSCWGVMVIFTIFVQFVAPTWLMPLFNKFTPLAEGELREQIMSYARSVGFSLRNVFVMDGSKRSSKSNAFFTGFGRHKRIALFDTLIARHAADELLAVLAHEIGHYKKKHILQGMIIGFLHTGAMLYLLSLVLESQGLFQAFGLNSQPVYAGLLFFGLLLSPFELIIAAGMNILARKNEFEADRFAVQTTGRHESLIMALKKLSVHNLANLTPHPFLVFLHYSHPPLLQRIKAIQACPLTAAPPENTANRQQ